MPKTFKIGKKIVFYIGKEYIFSFFVSFTFFFFVFFVNQILVYMRRLLASNVPFFSVVILAIFSLPAVMAFSFPFASLVGSLMAIGRLNTDREFLAMETSGISIRNIFIPIILVGSILFLTAFFFSDYLYPTSFMNIRRINRELTQSNPNIILQSFSANVLENKTFVTGEVDGERIQNLIILDTTKENEDRMITAKTARVIENERQKNIFSLELRDVFRQTISPDKLSYNYVVSDVVVYNVLLKDLSGLNAGVSIREMTTIDQMDKIAENTREYRKRLKAHNNKIEAEAAKLYGAYYYLMESINVGQPDQTNSAKDKINNIYKKIESLRSNPPGQRSIDSVKTILHERISMAFACLSLVILAFPLGMLPKKSGRMFGFAVGLFLSFAFYGLLLLGRFLVSENMISPAGGMWLPNVLILGIASILLYSRLRK